jgi:hypothetical protein
MIRPGIPIPSGTPIPTPSAILSPESGGGVGVDVGDVIAVAVVKVILTPS